MKINRDNYEEWLLRKVENDLSAGEVKALNQFLQQHPEYKAELEAFEKTVLVPPVVVFKNKKSLYREAVVEPKVIPIWQRRPMYWAAAASIALVVGLSIWLMNNQQPSLQQDVVISTPNTNTAQPIDSASTKPFQRPLEIENEIEAQTEKPNIESIASQRKSKPIESIEQRSEIVHQPVPQPTDEKYFATAVTKRDAAPLQLLETYPMIQFEVTTFHQAVQPRDVSFIAQSLKAESAAERLVIGALEMSGKDDWAKAFKRYARMADKNVEVTFTSEKLNLHKTLFNTNN